MVLHGVTQIEGQRDKENHMRSEHAKKQSDEQAHLKRISKDLRNLAEKQADLAAQLTNAQSAHQAAIKKHAQADLDLQELLDSASKSRDAKVGHSIQSHWSSRMHVGYQASGTNSSTLTRPV